MTDHLDDAVLDAIETLAASATPGSWRFDDDEPGCTVYGDIVPEFGGRPVVGYIDATDNAAFITAARTDVPALVAEVRRLRAVVGRIAYPALMYDARVYMLSEDAPELLALLSPEQRALVGERPSEVTERLTAERDAAIARAEAAEARLSVFDGFVMVECATHDGMTLVDDGDGGTYACPFCALTAAEAAIDVRVGDFVARHYRVVKGEHMWCECRMWNNKCDWTYEEHIRECIARSALDTGATT